MTNEEINNKKYYIGRQNRMHANSLLLVER